LGVGVHRLSQGYFDKHPAPQQFRSEPDGISLEPMGRAVKLCRPLLQPEFFPFTRSRVPQAVSLTVQSRSPTSTPRGMGGPKVNSSGQAKRNIRGLQIPDLWCVMQRSPVRSPLRLCAAIGRAARGGAAIIVVGTRCPAAGGALACRKH
jgi:hypothetical protein